MKILILGGTKFFGREFAQERAKAGDSVTVFSRRCPAEDLPPSVTQIHGERGSLRELRELTHTYWDMVLDNLCFTPQDAEIAMSAFAGSVGLYVMVSTGDVHLTLLGAQSPYNEEMADRLPENPEVRKNNSEPYGLGKRDAEKLLLRAHKAADFPACIVRFPIVIGPRDSKVRAYSYWLRISDGGPILLPDGGLYYRRFIYSGDTVRALSLLAQHPHLAAGEVFHFGDTVPVTLREWLELSARLLEGKDNIVAVPAQWLSRHGFDMAGSPYFHPGNYVLGIEKAERMLGWVSTPRHQWMAETIRWYFENETPHPASYMSHRAQELELAKLWMETKKQ
jgi:nucleoside-diphosphate-sugar epimerase